MIHLNPDFAQQAEDSKEEEIKLDKNKIIHEIIQTITDREFLLLFKGEIHWPMGIEINPDVIRHTKSGICNECNKKRRKYIESIDSYRKPSWQEIKDLEMKMCKIVNDYC